jgi:thiamine biosynthesis lipoprotein
MLEIGFFQREFYLVNTSPRRSLCLGLIIFVTLLAGCQQRGPEVLKRAQFMMGTVVEITLIARDDQQAADAIRGAFQEVRRIEDLMSRRIKGSDVWRVNRAAGKGDVVVSRDLLFVIRVGLEASRLSGGAFDMTVGSLVSLWDRCWREDRTPSPDEVSRALGLMGSQYLEMDEDRQTLFLKRPGMELALGGIAKGYAVDRAFRFLQSRGFTDLIVNAGGDLRTGGTKFGAPWVVGIQDPRNKTRVMATIAVKDGAIATSGDYERYFIKDGVRYHHILDPVTGFPARASRSVTILADELIWADALATAVFVLGGERGMPLIEELQGTEALIVDGEGKATLSSGMKGRVKFQ